MINPFTILRNCGKCINELQIIILIWKLGVIKTFVAKKLFQILFSAPKMKKDAGVSDYMTYNPYGCKSCTVHCIIYITANIDYKLVIYHDRALHINTNQYCHAVKAFPPSFFPDFSFCPLKIFVLNMIIL